MRVSKGSLECEDVHKVDKIIRHSENSITYLVVICNITIYKSINIIMNFEFKKKKKYNFKLGRNYQI